MTLVRFLLPNVAVCRRYFPRCGMSCRPLCISQLSHVHLNSLNRMPASRMQAGLFTSALTRLKHDAHVHAAVLEAATPSPEETPKVDVSKKVDQCVTEFLQDVFVMCEKVQTLGLPPSTQWHDDLSAKHVDRLREMVASLPHSTLLRVLVSLQSLPEVDDFIKELIVSEWKKSLRYFGVSQLLHVVQLEKNKESFCKNQSVSDDAMASIKQRWVEIGSGRDVVTLLYLASDDETEFLDHLEDRALELCGTMSVKELYRTVYCLARRRRRNTPLLRALMYHLNRQELNLRPVHVANLAYALGVLNVHDAGVMKKLSESVCEILEKDTHPPAIIHHMVSSVIRSLGILRHLYSPLMDMVVEWYRRRNVESSDWVRLLHTLAWVNYVPAQLGRNGVREVTEKAVTLHRSDTVLWLDAVWSCCVLNSLTADLAASVLSPEFVAALQGTDGINFVGFSCKLVDINTAARNMLAGYTGPLLSKEFVDSAKKAMASVESHSDLFNSILQALSEMAPAGRYIRTDVAVEHGPVIDIMMLVNKKGDPQPFADNVPVPASSVSSQLTTHRVAFQVLEFSDMISGGETVEPSGPSVLKSRCLAESGYKVVQVPHSEFDISSRVVKRVQYLVRKIREAISPGSADLPARKVEDEQRLMPKESELDSASFSTPVAKTRESRESFTFLQELLKSDSFLSSFDEDKSVVKTENKRHSAKLSERRRNSKRSTYVDQLLKSDSFLATGKPTVTAGLRDSASLRSDESATTQDDSVVSLESADSMSVSPTVSSGNGGKKLRKTIKTRTAKAPGEVGVGAKCESTLSESGAVTSDAKAVGKRTRKKMAELSDAQDNSATPAADSNDTITVTSSTASAAGVPKKKPRKAKRKSAASEEITKSNNEYSE